MKDPRSFTIPCTIGDCTFNNILCDLGASINLMPYSMMQKLGLDEPKPTNVSLQLVDRSITYPKGVLEDVLVKVGKFIFPIDFIVLDMEEDLEVPLILRRPFLATGRALIDVQRGNLILRINNEHVTFDMFKAMKHPSNNETCFMVDTIDHIVDEDFQVSRYKDPLEGYIAEAIESRTKHEHTMESVKHLEESLLFLKRHKHLDLGSQSSFKLKPSIEDPPTLELKPLPSHLKYAFLEKYEKLLVLISIFLTGDQKEKLLEVLRKHKRVIGWTITNIKGIYPSICTLRILMEEEHKPKVQPQIRLNPSMKEVVKAEIIMLLDSGIIYPIFFIVFGLF